MRIFEIIVKKIFNSSKLLSNKFARSKKREAKIDLYLDNSGEYTTSTINGIKIRILV